MALVASCNQTLDAGYNRPQGLLPVDERNPVILYQDDWSGDWLGEYAVLFANSGGPALAGIVVNADSLWGNVEINSSGWKDLVTAARSSGLQNIPDVTASTGPALARPADGVIEDTATNDSAGAELILTASRRLSTATVPLVVVSGTSLTDVADAYLVDHSVVDRVVIVAALGSYSAPNGLMNGPNGNLDPWASWIVAQRFRYVQVSAYYDQTGDVTSADLPSLPQNALGKLMASRQPNILTVATAADQVALLAVALPGFVAAVQRSGPDPSAGFDSTQGPPLVPDPGGSAWVVTEIVPPLAQAQLWQMLLDPHTFGS